MTETPREILARVNAKSVEQNKQGVPEIDRFVEATTFDIRAYRKGANAVQSNEASRIKLLLPNSLALLHSRTEKIDDEVIVAIERGLSGSVTDLLKVSPLIHLAGVIMAMEGATYRTRLSAGHSEIEMLIHSLRPTVVIESIALGSAVAKKARVKFGLAEAALVVSILAQGPEAVGAVDQFLEHTLKPATETINRLVTEAAWQYAGTGTYAHEITEDPVDKDELDRRVSLALAPERRSQGMSVPSVET